MEWGAGFVLGLVLGYAAGRQKPWWELSTEEKKKRMPVIIALLILLVLGALGAFLIM